MGTFGTQTLRIANKTACTTEKSQTACGFVIEFVTIVTDYKYNSTDINVGGCPDSEIRTYINNDIYNALPTSLKFGIISTKVISSHGNTEGEENFESIDKLYLLDLQEIFGNNSESRFDTTIRLLFERWNKPKKIL